MNPEKRSDGLKSSKPNRKRDVHFHFWTTDEEAALIRDRMASVGVTNLGAFIRKMCIDGYYINLDLSAMRELISLLRYCSNNLNQYAKKANETGSVYESDIEDLRIRLDSLWDMANGILRELAGIQ